MVVLSEKILRLMSSADRKKLGKGGLLWSEAKELAAAKNERELQGQLVQLLRRKGIEVLWHRTDRRSAATIGWPEITFAAGGQSCAWEVKFGDGELSTEQKQMAVRMMSPPNCWWWRVIRSYDDALAELKELGL